MLIPGCHIPIIDEKTILKKQPDYLLLLSWHYWKPILKNNKKGGDDEKVIFGRISMNDSFYPWDFSSETLSEKS